MLFGDRVQGGGIGISTYLDKLPPISTRAKHINAIKCIAMKFTKEQNLLWLQLHGVGKGRDFMFWTTTVSDKIQFNANRLKYLIFPYQAGCCGLWGWDLSFIISSACPGEGWNDTKLHKFQSKTKNDMVRRGLRCLDLLKVNGGKISRNLVDLSLSHKVELQTSPANDWWADAKILIWKRKDNWKRICQTCWYINLNSAITTVKKRFSQNLMQETVLKAIKILRPFVLDALAANSKQWSKVDKSGQK